MYELHDCIHCIVQLSSPSTRRNWNCILLLYTVCTVLLNNWVHDHWLHGQVELCIYVVQWACTRHGREQHVLSSSVHTVYSSTVVCSCWYDVTTTIIPALCSVCSHAAHCTTCTDELSWAVGADACCILQQYTVLLHTTVLWRAMGTGDPALFNTNRVDIADCIR